MCKDTPTLPLLQILMDIKTKKANLVAIPHYFDTLFALRNPPKQPRGHLARCNHIYQRELWKRKEIEAARAAAVKYKILRVKTLQFLRVKTLQCRVITLKSDKYCKHLARSCTMCAKIYFGK